MIEVEHRGRHVAIVKNTSRPLGVLGIAARQELLQHLKELDGDRRIRAIVITGSGTAFSVGADIREFRPEEDWLRAAEQIETQVNQCIEDLRCPVIAALNGHTYGAGLVLATACDIRIAAASARLGVPEVKLGGIASGSGTQRLAELIGRGGALSLLLTGRIVSAGEALAMRLIDSVSPDERLVDDAVAMAEDIAEMPPLAIAETKASVNEGVRNGREAGLRRELQAAIALGLSEDALEGQRAFIEKRPAKFPSAI